MTAQPKHAPGDWSAHGCTVYSGDVAVAVAYVEHVREDIQDLMPALVPATWAEAYSNAALIAAAPDLLAVAEAVSDRLSAWIHGERQAQIAAEERRDRHAAEGHYNAVKNYLALAELARAALAKARAQS